MVSDILPPIFGLLEHPSREVLKSTLGFIQVVLKSLPVHMTIPHLPDLISKLLPWTDRGSCPGTTRVRIKNLFEKFIRKFGCVVQSPFCCDVPVADHTVMVSHFLVTDLWQISLLWYL